MAGGKETPRQKMIGMMYLVLTALLALQVTSAILEKFVLLNNSLEQSTGSANRVNQETLEKIRAAVSKTGNRPADAAVLQQADQVRKKTADMMSQIDALKSELVQAGGGLDEEGSIKNLSEEDKVAQLLVGNNRNGAAYKLQGTLNQFTEELSKIGNAKFAPLAMDGKDDPTAKRSSEQRTKDFATLNFAQTPVPAAMAVLSQKQADVRRIEGETLDYLATKVGAQDVKFDKIMGMLSMQSNVVVAGTKFRGEMFLAASSSGIQPRMSLSGGPVRMDNGRGIIEFTAQGGSYDSQGLSKRVLSGMISYNAPDGTIKSVPVKAEYAVAKPTYNIETGTLPPLYLGCENKLSIQSPQLGALWNPNISADGASVIQSGAKGKVTIVPNSASVMVNISNAGNLLGREPFRVNRVPRPSIEYGMGGRSATADPRGVPIGSARSLSVRAVADPSFAAFAPSDANFRVTGVTVNLVRGIRRVMGPLSLGSGGGSLGAMAGEMQPGDRITITVEGVQRRNFRGDISDVPMGNPTKQISLY